MPFISFFISVTKMTSTVLARIAQSGLVLEHRGKGLSFSLLSRMLPVTFYTGSGIEYISSVFNLLRVFIVQTVSCVSCFSWIYGDVSMILVFFRYGAESHPIMVYDPFNVLWFWIQFARILLRIFFMYVYQRWWLSFSCSGIVCFCMKVVQTSWNEFGGIPSAANFWQHLRKIHISSWILVEFYFEVIWFWRLSVMGVLLSWFQPPDSLLYAEIFYSFLIVDLLEVFVGWMFLGISPFLLDFATYWHIILCIL